MDRRARSSFPLWPAFAVMLVAAAYLGVRWGDIPAQWPVHWNAAGKANGWAERTPAGVFGMLAMNAAVLLFVESLIAVMSPGARPDDAKAPVRLAAVHLARLVLFGLTLVLSFFAVALPFGAMLAPPVVLAGALAVMGAATAVGARRVSQAIREVREGHPEAVEGWHGLHYANPKDERLWVPKLTGMGVTLNFSHPMAWPVMIALVAIPIGIAIVSIALSR